jgi:PleD family two-component response regulator
LATEILIITRDDGLIRRLELQADPERISIRFARSGYEGSAIVSTFSPALVLIDSDLSEVRTGTLHGSILQDERIPAARVVVACRKGHEETFENPPVLTVPAPFTADDVERLAAQVARVEANAPRDVA